MILLNWRCPNCGAEKEVILHRWETPPEDPLCERCDWYMEAFNFARNARRADHTWDGEQ